MVFAEIIRQTSKCGLSILIARPIGDYSQKVVFTIFVPGYSCRASDFAALITLLSTDSPTQQSKISTGQYFISIDLPGHGETPQLVCPEPSVDDFARLVNEVKSEFVESVAGEAVVAQMEVVLAGHSLGARIVLEAFRQDPTNVKGVVFVDGSHYLLRPKGYLEQQQATFGQASETSPTSANIHAKPKAPGDVRVERGKAIEVLFSTMFSALTPPELKAQAIADAKASMEYLIPLRRSHMKWDQQNMDTAIRGVGRAKLPVLVVQSTDGSGLDRRGLIVGEENGWMGFVRERVANEQYESVVVEGCGHFPHVDRSEEMANIIREWLGKICGR